MNNDSPSAPPTSNAGSDRVLIVTNPTAGARPGGPAVWDLVECIRRRGLQADVITDLGALDRQAARLHAAGELRAIVAAGGDGTVAEIVNRTEPGLPITVFPLGTANLLAKYLRISRDPAALAKTLAEGCVARLDAATANGRVFSLMAGCGFDAAVVEHMHRHRIGRHINYWSWARPILNAIRSYEYPDLRIYCQGNGDGVEEAWNMRWAFVTNLPCYAAGLRVSPEAAGNDGRLNVSTFGNGSLWHGLRYVGSVALGRHQVLSDFKTVLATHVRIESDKSVPYQLDGDPGGVLPLDIEVLKDRLTIVAPRASLESLGLAHSMPTGAPAS